MPSHSFAGTVQSGGTTTVLPLEGVPVTLYHAGPGAPRAVGSGTSGPGGRFSIHPEGAGGDGVFYAVAAVRDQVVLVTVVGPELAGEVVINELTTVAAAYSMAQFAGESGIRGGAFALRIAAGMNHNLVDTRSGGSSQVLLGPPNADQTNALRSTRSLGNLVAACVRGRPGAEARFLALTTPPGEPPSADTFQALLNLARNPANQVGELFNVSQGVPSVYAPALFSQPDAWTLAVKVNDSGDDDYLFGGPANVAFDDHGYAWIPNNVFQGTPNSGNFAIVLRPDGKPARGEDGRPTSPVLGGGLKGPGWGVTIDRRHRAWIGNFGWGDPDTQYPVDGTVSAFRADGTPLSGDGGYGGGGLDRAQAVVADPHGNLWIASFGSGRVVVFPDGDPERAVWRPAGKGTFGIAIAPDGTAWVAAGGGGLGWPTASQGSVHRFRLEGGELREVGEPFPVGNASKVIAVDSLGNAWLASSGDSTVYQLGPNGTVASYTGVGGMDTPWGMCVDGDDHVWVGNFGVLGMDSDYTYAGLTKLAGANPATRPAGMNAGDPLSPPTGFTLPSAGDPVLLHDGEPVYRDGTECYSPMMRATSCQIDAAGNVWVVNNWKPRFATAFPPNEGNPGGDGVVIFVGLARPPRPTGPAA